MQKQHALFRSVAESRGTEEVHELHQVNVEAEDRGPVHLRRDVDPGERLADDLVVLDRLRDPEARAVAERRGGRPGVGRGHLDVEELAAEKVGVLHRLAAARDDALADRQARDRNAEVRRGEAEQR